MKNTKKPEEDQVLNGEESASKQLLDPPPCTPTPTPKNCSALKNQMVAAISNLSTAYNLTIVASVNAVMKNQYCPLTRHYEGLNPAGEVVYASEFDKKCEAADDFAKVACIIGAIVGQVMIISTPIKGNHIAIL